MRINNLTTFVITTGQDINYSACIEALQKQTIDFHIDIIRGYAPLSLAFQQMIDRVKTDYFIEVDEDIILQPNAVEILYNMIVNNPEYVMVCCMLHDVHYNIPIRGVKIYNSTIFKK